jgi:hypothetical protein
MKRIIIFFLATIISILSYSEDFKVVTILSNFTLSYKIKTSFYTITFKKNEKYFIKIEGQKVNFLGIDSLIIILDNQKYKIDAVTKAQDDFLKNEGKNLFTYKKEADSVLTSFTGIRDTYKITRISVWNTRDSIISKYIVTDKGFPLKKNELLFKVKIDLGKNNSTPPWPIFFFYLDTVRIVTKVPPTPCEDNDDSCLLVKYCKDNKIGSCNASPEKLKEIKDMNVKSLKDSTINRISAILGYNELKCNPPIPPIVKIGIGGLVLLIFIVFLTIKFSLNTKIVTLFKKIFHLKGKETVPEQNDEEPPYEPGYVTYPFNKRTLRRYIQMIKDKFYDDLPNKSDEELLRDFITMNEKKLSEIATVSGMKTDSYEFLQEKWEDENAPYNNLFSQFKFNIKIQVDSNIKGGSEPKTLKNDGGKDKKGGNKAGNITQGNQQGTDDNKKSYSELKDSLKDISERISKIENQFTSTYSPIVTSIKSMELKHEALGKKLEEIQQLNKELVTDKVLSNQKQFEERLKKLNFLDCPELMDYGQSCYILLRECQTIYNSITSLGTLLPNSMNTTIFREIATPISSPSDFEKLTTWIWIMDTMSKEGKVTSNKELLTNLTQLNEWNDQNRMTSDLQSSFFTFLQRYLSLLIIACQDIKHFDKLSPGFDKVPLNLEFVFERYIKDLRGGLKSIGLEIQYIEIFEAPNLSLCLQFPQSDLSNRYKSIEISKGRVLEIKEFGFKQIGIGNKYSLDYKISPYMEKTRIIVA